MMYYYMKVDETTGAIAYLESTTSVVVENGGFVIVPLTEQQYSLLLACRGDITEAIKELSIINKMRCQAYIDYIDRLCLQK